MKIAFHILLFTILAPSRASGAQEVGEQYENKYVCRTEVCKQRAKFLKTYMDQTVSPCQDFYSYACGGWADKHKEKKPYDVFEMMKEEFTTALKDILEPMNPARRTGQSVVDKAAVLYHACLRVPEGNKNLEPLLKILRTSGLEMWPVVQESGVSESKFGSLEEVLQKAGANPFVEIFIARGVSAPAKYMLKVLPFTFRLVGSRDPIEAALKFVKPTICPNVLNSTVNAIIKFEQELFKTILAPARTGRPLAVDTVANFEKSFPEFPLLTALRREFVKAGVTLEKDDIVEMHKPDVYSAITGFLKNAKLEDVFNYIGVHFVISWAPQVSAGFPNPLSAVQRTEGCVSHVSSVMKEVMTYLFVTNKVPPYAMIEIMDIIRRIKESFRETFRSVPWMDPETAARAVEKLEQMAAKIGYPAWPMNIHVVEDLYRYVEDIDPTLPFIDMMFAVTQNNEKVMIEKVGKPYDSKSDWLFGPSPVHASYNPGSNEIMYPAGALQSPFYSYGLPKSLNFGAIGAVLAHEMSHGFAGRLSFYDAKGRPIGWWSNHTKKEFLQTEECFRKQYGSITDKTTNIKLNEKATFDEDIADNGGLEVVHKAYQKLVQVECKSAPTARLEGLEDLTGQQLLFLSYAAMWCNAITPEQLQKKITRMPHSPNQYRVTVPLENLPAFTTAFNCTSNQDRERKTTCSLWRKTALKEQNGGTR